MGSVESVKAVSEVYSPISGQVVEINSALVDSPETLNQDPYGKGWLALIEPERWQAERASLLGPDAYLVAMRAQAEEELHT